MVERHVANVNVEGSNPFSRFFLTPVTQGVFFPKDSEPVEI